ncbi:MAG: HAMP domain-containing sensor histidine kinase [Candidatus Thiodiazotropha sp. 6PLUC2]
MSIEENTESSPVNRTLSSLELSSAFAMVLHDIKNSLGVLLRDINMITGSCEFTGCGMRNECADMEYEVRRINNNIVKMLTLFKVEQGDYMLNVDAHSVFDFLNEVMIEHSLIMREKKVTYEIDCPKSLYWYFDRNLMTGVMSNAISNALRYTKDRIRISADSGNKGLRLAIEDNGQGYTKLMLEQQAAIKRPESGFLNNNTGLGIYFTKLVLDLHQHDDIYGKVAMQNGGELGGGQLFMTLP